MAPPARTSKRDSRARLVETGLRLFARKGFDGVSTRDLAADAGVALAAIPYHFRGKQGLYDAVVDQLVERVRLATAPILAQIDATLQQAAGDRCRLSEGLGPMVESMLRQSLALPDANWSVFLIHREFVEASDAFSRMHRGFILDQQQAFARLVHAATGLEPSSVHAKVLANAIEHMVFVDTTYRIALGDRLSRPVARVVAELAPPITAAIRALLGLSQPAPRATRSRAPRR